MSDIFISYASEDRERVRHLAQALEANGWSVWWDRHIVAGQVFDQVIEHELETARCVVVLWSKNSIASEWVKNEAAVASERGVLVPAIIENIKPPLGFRRKQTADLQEWDGDTELAGYRSLCDGITAKLDPSATHKRRPSLSKTIIKEEWIGSSIKWGVVVIILLAGILVVYQMLQARREQQTIQKQIQAVDGVWYADIQYSWGVTAVEKLEFEVVDRQLLGTVSFGGESYLHQILDGKFAKNRLSFRIKLNSQGSDRYFQYQGKVSGSQINFILHNMGIKPTNFIAARTLEQARKFGPRRATGGIEPRPTHFQAGAYKLNHVKTKVRELKREIKACYVASEFDPVDHVQAYYYLKITPDGTVTESGAPGTDQRSISLDRCMDSVFRSINWGKTPTGQETEIRIGFKALPSWRSD
jgi:TIR domain-containing protein